MSVVTIVNALQDVTGGISGIKKAPDEPPEQMNVFPFVVAYPSGGTLTGATHSTRFLRNQHTLVCEIHIQRKNLPLAVNEALPYLELFKAAIVADPTLNSTCKIDGDIDYTFGSLPSYGGVDTVGFSFTINVQETT